MIWYNNWFFVRTVGVLYVTATPLAVIFFPFDMQLVIDFISRGKLYEPFFPFN
jgi:hypothetical protein